MGLLNSAAGLAASYVERQVGRGWICAMAKLVIGTSGAVAATSAADHPDIAFTLSSTGVYTMTYPPAIDACIQLGCIKSAAGTITEFINTAKSATAGTATIQLSKGGIAAQPASGDEIMVFLYLKIES